MEVKLKSFDIRKPQVSIGTKPFLTVEKTVRETVGTAGNLLFVSKKNSFIYRKCAGGNRVMAISSFTGNLTNTVAKINEISAANGWGITAAKTSSPSNNTLAISDANGHVLIALTGITSGRDGEDHGIRFYYNNGSSYRGQTNNYGSGTLTATLYISSHGFIIVNNSYRNDGICAAWINVSDDGTIIYGGTDSTSTVSTTLSGHLIGCKYDETSYQNLAFTPHTNPAGTTLCNATAVGSLGEPQIAKYMFYTPVYQSAQTGEVGIDGERYVAYGSVWYLKD